MSLILLAVLAQPALAEHKLLGVEWKLDDGALVVMKVLPGGAAVRAGVRVGERIVAIDGQSIANLSADDVTTLLEDKGLPVTLTIASNGRAPRRLRISREQVEPRKPKEAEAGNAAVLAAAAAHSRVLARREMPGMPPGQIEVGDEPADEVFSREVEFMAKIGELTASERESLAEQGKLAMRRREAMPAAPRMNPAGRRVAVIVNGQNQVRQVRQAETPGQAVRRDLTPVLKSISHEAWEKFDAARERLDQRQRRAEVLTQVVAFDDALLLTGQQREKLDDLISTQWTNFWRGRGEAALADPVRVCLSLAGVADLLPIPEVDLDRILRPSQVAAFNLLQSPARVETVIAEPGPQANPAPANPVAPNQARQLAIRVGMAAAGPGQANAAGTVVRHGLPLDEERQRLRSLLERLVEDADVQAELDDALQQKLALAGKLDIERHFQQYAWLEGENGGPGKIVAKMQSQVVGTKVRLPPIFSDPESMFQKALRGRLSPDQLKMLAAGQRERGRFRQQAVFAALTVALMNRAALSDVQAERLEEWLIENLSVPTDADDLAAWRRAMLETFGALRPDALKPLVDDWQWPAAQGYLKELIARARAAAAQPGDLPPAVEAEEMLLGIPVEP